MHAQATPLPPDFFDTDAISLASALVGTTLELNGVGGIIVETEAYLQDDPASHSFRGPTPRNGAMFGPSGTVYVYRSYGIHWCLNIVAQPGSAVLIRALEPRMGIDEMVLRRGGVGLERLCKGPGCLTQALGVDISHNDSDLYSAGFAVSERESDTPVIAGRRIGITKAADMPWRFGLKGSRFVSKPFG